MRGKSYVVKSVIQMVLQEGYKDRGVIAEELGVSRKYIANVINNLDPQLRDRIKFKLGELPKDN